MFRGSTLQIVCRREAEKRPEAQVQQQALSGPHQSSSLASAFHGGAKTAEAELADAVRRSSLEAPQCPTIRHSPRHGYETQGVGGLGNWLPIVLMLFICYFVAFMFKAFNIKRKCFPIT